MKYFACILSFYILALTAVPCADKPLCEVMQKKDITGNPGENHEHGNDSCSPFCTCNCCTSPRIQEDFTIDFRVFTISEKIYFVYTPDFIPEYTSSIWQPPKIG